MVKTQIPDHIVKHLEQLKSLIYHCRFNLELDNDTIKDIIRLVIQCIRMALLPTSQYYLDKEDEAFVDKMAEAIQYDLL